MPAKRHLTGRPFASYRAAIGSRMASQTNYRGMRILVMTGTADADHPRKLDESIVKWLNQNGAKAGDRGIVSAMAT